MAKAIAFAFNIFTLKIVFPQATKEPSPKLRLHVSVCLRFESDPRMKIHSATQPYAWWKLFKYFTKSVKFGVEPFED